MSKGKSKAKGARNSGRFQAQGGIPDLCKSQPWCESQPLKYDAGKDLLRALVDQLEPVERNSRYSGIIECSKEIKKMHQIGGFIVVDKPYSQSFPRLAGPDGERVDLEIKTGKAFI